MRIMFLTAQPSWHCLKTSQELKQSRSCLKVRKKVRLSSLPLLYPLLRFLYITLREKGEEEAKRRIKLMNTLAMTRVESSQELGLIAGKLKATQRVSFADTWIAATAIFYDAILVHKDPEFEQVKVKLKILKLPYKQKDKK